MERNDTGATTLGRTTVHRMTLTEQRLNWTNTTEQS